MQGIFCDILWPDMNIRHTSEFAFVANRNRMIDHCIAPDSENSYKAESWIYEDYKLSLFHPLERMVLYGILCSSAKKRV
jgi:hypothetical protein